MRRTTVLRCTALGAAVAVAGTTMTGCAATSTTTALPVAATASVSPGPVTAAIPAVAKPTSAAPALKNTGTAWPTVIASMLTYGQWLLANPNPALAITITEPGCASANQLTAQLQSLVEQSIYVQPSAVMLTSIVGPYPKGSTAASAASSAASIGGRAAIDVQAVRAAEPVVERAHARTTSTKVTSATRVLQDKAKLPPTTLRMTLVLGSDNRWRFCGVTDVVNGPDTEAISALL